MSMRIAGVKAPLVAAANFMRPLYTQKIDELLAQYAAKETRDSRTERVPPWDEEEVRRDLELKTHVQKAGLKIFRQRKTLSDAEQEIEDVERAGLAVLERFLYSHHLSSRQEFLDRAKIIRGESGPYLTAHNHAIFEQGWRDALDRLVMELTEGWA